MFLNPHACPRNGVAAGKREGIYVSIGTGRRLANDRGQFVVLDKTHKTLCITDRAAIDQENDFRVQVRYGGLQLPAYFLPARNSFSVGVDDLRNLHPFPGGVWLCKQVTDQAMI